MKHIKKETVSLFVMSCGLLFISLPNIHLGLLNFIFSTAAWEARSKGITQVGILYGIILFGLTVLSYIASLDETTLISLLKKTVKEAFSEIRNEIFPSIQSCFVSKHDNFWLIIAVIVGVGTTGYFLAQPMRWDESYTFLRFVNRGFINLFYYPSPNNHVLNTLLVRLSTVVFGSSPVSIRIPAFLAGIGVIPATFCLCRTLKKSGVFASFAASVFPYLVLFSTMARGYSLLVLLTLILTFIGVQVSRKVPTTATTILLSLIAALGMLTIPSMLYPIAGIYCWLFFVILIKGQSIRIVLTKYVIPCGLFTSLFTIILYTPVILASNGLDSIIANRYVQSNPWSLFIRQILPHFQSTTSNFFRNIPPIVLIICIILVIIGIFDSVKKREWSFLLIFPMVFLGSFIVFFAKHAIPFSRTWIYFIPFILIYADSGLTYIIENVSGRIKTLALVMVFIGITFASVSLMSNDIIAKYPDTGAFPEAQMVAKFLEPLMMDNDLVTGKIPTDIPTNFYLWYYTGKEHDSKTVIDPENIFYIVKKNHSSITELTDGEVVKLLDIGNVALYQEVEINGN